MSTWFSDCHHRMNGMKPRFRTKYGISTNSSKTRTKYEYWKNADNQREYFNWLAKRLDIKKPDDWYNISYRDIRKHGTRGASILSQYGTSLFKALKRVYPDIDWKQEEFKSQSALKYNTHQQRKYFEQIAEQLEIKEPSDWYKYTKTKLLETHPEASTIFNYHKGSLSETLKDLYPEVNWDPLLWTFSVPKYHWKKVENQREYFDWIGNQLNIQKPEDWYKVSQMTLRTQYPRSTSILSYHNDSLKKALEAVYPEVQWQQFAWKRVFKNTWKDTTQLKAYLDELCTKLGINSSEDWYNIHRTQLKVLPKWQTVLKRSSLSKLLMTLYPQIDWKPWKFQALPRNIWKVEGVTRRYLDEMAKEMNVNHPRDWISETARLKLLQTESGRSLLCYYQNSFTKVLQTAYPEFNEWKEEMLELRKSDIELSVRAVLSDIFPNTEIHSCYVMHFGELDFYIPSLSIAFEVQGQMHYTDRYRGSMQKRTDTDTRKREQCSMLGITLIEIGYWWDGSASSLMSKILHYRPDLNTLIGE